MYALEEAKMNENIEKYLEERKQQKPWQEQFKKQAAKEKSDYELKPLPYSENALEPFLSKKVVNWHHQKHHQGYVDKRNEIVKKLKKNALRADANMKYSEYGELKRRESFNANGILLHEVYWGSMGGDGKHKNDLSVLEQINEDFGSYDSWAEDLTASAKASLGWAVLAWDMHTKRLHNYMCDFHNKGVEWGALPIVAIDVFEHAYYHDYGPDRGKYIKGFLKTLHWERINECFENMRG